MFLKKVFSQFFIAKDNNLASELVENRTFLNQSQARKL